MNTKNLYDNQIIANYPALCVLLDIESVIGKGKELFLSKLHRYCSYSKDKHKFIIHEVYEVPLPKINTSQESLIIESVLLDYLSRNMVIDDEEVVSYVYLSKKELYLLAGLGTQVFFNSRNNSNRLGKSREQSEVDFFRDSSVKMQNSVASLVRSLINRHIVHIVPVYVYLDMATNSLDKVEASSDLSTKINEVYGECLRAADIDCSSEFMVARKNLSTLYYNKVNKLLMDRYNIRAVRRKYRFSFTNQIKSRIEAMQKEVSYVLGQKIETNSSMMLFLERKLQENAEKSLYLSQLDLETKKIITGEELKERYIREYKELIETIKLTEEVS